MKQGPKELKIGSHVYCTLFDSGYMSRGLSLFSSLREHGDLAPIYVLALDEQVELFLNNQNLFENIVVFNMTDLEHNYPELLKVKSIRSRMEYIFTCTPFLIDYVSHQSKLHNQLCIYLDSDLFYFSDPLEITKSLKNASIGLTPHRYPKILEQKLSKYGTFNAGWIAVRADANGVEALNWYKSQTLSWCSDKPTEGKYADQGYLNELSEMPGAVILESPGINHAPWNTKNVSYSRMGSGAIMVDSTPLIVFHFHGLRKIGAFWATSQLIYKSPLTKFLRINVYTTYLERLDRYEDILAQQFNRTPVIRKRGNGVHGALSRLRKKSIDVISVLSGNAIKMTQSTPR